MHRSIRLRCALVVLACAAAPCAQAGEISPAYPWTVGSGIDCEFPSIQAALDAVAAQTQSQTIRVSRMIPHTGLHLTVHGGNDVTLDGGYATCASGRDTTPTAIVGNGTQPVIRTLGGGNITLRNLDISGGRGEITSDGGMGGGGVWHVSSGQLLVDDSTVHHNVGGVHVEGSGSAVVRRSALHDMQDAALSADTSGSVTVDDSSIAASSVGIRMLQGRLDVVGGSVSGNDIGIALLGPDATLLVDVEVVENSSYGVGTGGSGALALDRVQLLRNGPLATNCNTIGHGALVSTFGTGAITVANSTISENCRGIHLMQGPSLDIERTTIADNESNTQGGAGIRVEGAADGPAPVVRFGADVIVERNGVAGFRSGISVVNATLDLSDAPGFAIRDNGGVGLWLEASNARIGSGGAGGGIRGNAGGGIGMSGGSDLVLYTTDPAHPAGLWDNSTGSAGGGLLLQESEAVQTVRFYDVQIVGNTAVAGAALAVYGGLEGDTRVCMGRAIEPDSCSDLGGALPANARACADAANCNVIRDNVASGSYPATEEGPEGVVLRGAHGIAPMPMRFVGARFEDNSGRALFTSRPMQPALPAPVGTLELRDSVVAANEATHTLFDSASDITGFPPYAAYAFGALSIERSTIAGNGIGADTVIGSTQQLVAHESIVHQPEKRVHAGIDGGIDARSIIVADATALPLRADVVVADPLLADAANGNVRPLPGSPAIDFSNLGSGGVDIDGVPRGQDAPGAPTRFGLRDLGAHEVGVSILFRDGFEGGAAD